MSAAPLFESGYLRIRACRHGLMLYNTNDIYIGRSLDQYGEYAQAELDVIRQLLRPKTTVIDIGANIGTHSVFFARALGHEGRVISFEPQPFVFQMLCTNLLLNGLNQVEPRNMAVGAEPGTLQVMLPDYGAANNFGGIALNNTPKGRRISVCSLDQEEYQNLGLIKADVEGMELAVLEGAKATIAHHRPILYLECSPNDPRSTETIRYILHLNYRIYVHRPSLFNPENHYKNELNLFPQIISANIICIPQENRLKISDAPEINTIDQWPA